MRAVSLLLRRRGATPTVVRVASRGYVAPKDGFDAAETEKAIGALQRLLRNELSEQSFDDALNTAEELRSLARDAYGSTGNTILAAALNDSALVHKGRREFETAVELLVEAVRQYDSCGLRNHPSSATALHNMGVAYKEHAQAPETGALERVSLLDRAAECLVEANERRAARTDDDTIRRAVATTRVVLASVRRLQKRIADARDEIDEALAVLRVVDTTIASRTALATALNNAAYFEKQDGNDADASKLYHEALDLRETVLGPEHPQTIATLHNIAELHEAFGRLDQANAVRRNILRRLGVEGDDRDDATTTTPPAIPTPQG
ncbi:hypothetical protein CTAYLR_005317 [Chrysophaeum taylorii]|uniref:Kinesin light chain n=1 Tax=Chrysophaeum taylorii TaxID=2483200 RepID=A0AAD7ULL5_9STRA|nr:hypothetical protein CTAYLR_005317 [Chrysophaeum taylorii]